MNYLDAMKQALEALESQEAFDENTHQFLDLECFIDTPETRHEYEDAYRLRAKNRRAITNLRNAIAEIEKSEPAYAFHLDETGKAFLRGVCVSKEGDPLYLHPPLSDEPVAWMNNDDGEIVPHVGIEHGGAWIPLYRKDPP